jgi:alkylation response protein AidB-like acyl-CoA dehydrogenase
MTVEIIGMVGTQDVPDLAQVTRLLAERAEYHDRTAEFPATSIAAIHDAGLLTATVHQRYGGRGAGIAETGVILRALGQGDPSAALIAAMTMFAHALQGIEPTWPDDIYTAAVAESLTRPVLINALRVEPELGTPARGGLPATVASPDGDRWSLSGHKIFSTGAEGLRWMVVWARAGDTQRAGGFLVRSDAPGISIERTWDHLGLRASRSDDVRFQGTPAVATTGPGGGPLFLAWNSLGLTSLYLGVAAAAREWLVSFLTERTPASLGRPLATLPRFQAAVGEIDASLGTAVALLDATAAGVDGADAAAVARAPAVKLTGTRAAVDAVSQAVALIGNNGLTRHNPIERHLRDVLCARVHTPQDDSIVAAAGRAAFPGL